MAGNPASLIRRPQQWWQRRFAAWLDRRVPRRAAMTLNQGNIFIVPTAEGFFFLLLVLILLLTAINYQSSLLYLVTFLLGGVFVMAIMATYQGLAGLEIIGVEGGSAFPGESLCWRVRLNQTAGRPCPALQVSVPGGSEEIVGLAPGNPLTVTLSVQAQKRGPQWLPRVRFQSVYPLGLLRAWSWVALAHEALVYPRPIAGEAPQGDGEAEAGRQPSLQAAKGQEDFQGLRDYLPGDMPRRIDWKRYARDDQLRVKVFAGVPVTSSWLSLEDYPGRDIEQRLSLLCHQLLARLQRGEAVGLRLGTEQLGPATDALHQQRCLQALGRYGFGAPP